MKSWSRTLVPACLLALCLILPLAAAAQNAAPKEPMGRLILAMSTDDTAVFDGALTIGSVAAQRGHPVTLLLRIDAIKVVVAKNNYPVGDTTLARKLEAFMKSGATVIAGGSCLKAMGLKPAELLPGVAVGTPDMVMGALFEDGARILSY